MIDDEDTGNTLINNNDNNHSSNNNTTSKKKKTQTTVFSGVRLYTFVIAVHNLLLKLRNVRKNFNKLLQEYCDDKFIHELSLNNLKLDSITNVDEDEEESNNNDENNNNFDENNDEYTSTTNNNNLETDNNQITMSNILIQIINHLFFKLEDNKQIILFQRELIKYFVSSFHIFITIHDFDNTTNIKNKNTKRNVLNKGTILQEYIKSNDAFAANLSRCEISDMDALKLIYDKQLYVETFTNSIIHKLNLDIIKYEKSIISDMKFTCRNNYMIIPMSPNFKRTSLIITNFLLYLHDNTSISLPTQNIENQITPKMLNELNLKNGEYLWLDVMISTGKIKIIDLIDINKDNLVSAPSNYFDRINLISQVLPKVNLATANIMKSTIITDDENYQQTNEDVSNVQQQQHEPETQMQDSTAMTEMSLQSNNINNINEIEDKFENYDGSYIQKPINSLTGQPTYTYIKPNSTVAIIGMINKQALAAFKKDDSTLVYKLTVHNSQNINILLGTSKVQHSYELNEQQQPTIKSYTKDGQIVTYNIEGLDDLNDVQLFEFLVRSELKDTSKLGMLTDAEITNISEFKVHQTTPKDVLPPTLVKSVTQVINNADSVKALISIISASPHAPQLLELLKNQAHQLNEVNLGFS